MKRIAQLVGIDKAIFFSLLSRIVQGIGGIVTVSLIAKFLTATEQGFYFTFASILAVQVFFELGLNGIITQYVAHEVSHLRFNNNALEGESKHRSRLASLLHFCVKWYFRLVLFLLGALIISGIVFFNYFYKEDFLVNWQMPWILICLGTASNFLISPILAFIEGLGKVKEIAKIRLYQQSITILIMWICLFYGFKLYIGGLSVLAGSLLVYIFTLTRFGLILKGIFKEEICEKVSYRLEIFPFQWKIALSWISGFFIFQLFNPVLFAAEGPVVAGQMGMTMTVLNAIFALSFSWISTKIPMFSGFIAQKQYNQLDRVFNRTLIQSVSVSFLALSLFIVLVYIIKILGIQINGNLLANRFIPSVYIYCLALTIILNQIVGAWALYLRCHKREPMLIQSVTMGLLCTLSTILLGNTYGLSGVVFGYSALVIIGFVWTYFIFTSNKIKWHYE